MSESLDHLALYRLPWSLPDNAISWLEVTSKCNLACEGCYRENVPDGHKSLEQIEHELDVFLRLRKCDAVSIAGGDPLTHPNIVEIVRSVAKRGAKPILNTNGLALSPQLLLELRNAGLRGITFHIDSKQGRPGWKKANEIQLNELRLKFAKMVHSARNMVCAFNATVYADTLRDVPAVVAWGEKHVDIVQTLVFIAYRTTQCDAFDYFAGNRPVDMGELVYSESTGRGDILSNEIHATIQEQFPDFSSCAYLNGTEKPDSFKWLLTTRLGNAGGVLGYLGPKFMELAQDATHLTTGHYLGYSSPRTHRSGKALLLLAPFDRGVRKAAGRFLKSLLRRPLDLFRPLHIQSVMIIQPVDMMSDGAMSMCDSCPDITVWEDKLVWSCRLEEQMKFGGFLRTAPKQESSVTRS